MLRRTPVIAATMLATALSLTACGGGDTKSTSSSSSTSSNASQSGTSSASEASYLKNGKVNPLAVTQDNVGEVCTKLLGDPTKIYANTPAYQGDLEDTNPAPVTGDESVVGWDAHVTNYADQNGNYVSFDCNPKMGPNAGLGQKPGIHVMQYTNGYAPKSQVVTNPVFGVTPDYDKIVEGKVYVTSTFEMATSYASDRGIDRLANAVQSGRGMEVENSTNDGTTTMSPAQITANVKKWSAERVSIVKPFVDEAASNLTAG